MTMTIPILLLLRNYTLSIYLTYVYNEYGPYFCCTTGRKVCVLANLKDRNLAGFKSQGMVLCAVSADHTQIKLVDPPANAVGKYTPPHPCRWWLYVVNDFGYCCCWWFIMPPHFLVYPFILVYSLFHPHRPHQ